VTPDRSARPDQPCGTDQPGGTDPAAVGAAKRELRAGLLAARRARPVAQLHRLDAGLVAALTDWLDGHAPTTVAAYAPMPGEPGGPDLPARLAAHATRVLLPVLRPDNDLDWAVYQGELAPARRGLAEPPGARLGVGAVVGAGLVVVPAVAVDDRGMRLGRGGGSYDRALARVPPGALVLALLYPGERVDRVPALAHDRPVHGVVLDGQVTML
jgi:5-formyltetrahydrofolate cyclo-ligase